MDQAQIAELARQFVAYVAPLIAGGALAKAGEDTMGQAASIVTRSLDALRRRFNGSKKAELALASLEEDASDEFTQREVAKQIAARFATDAQAIAELQGLVAELKAQAGNALAPQRQHNLDISGNARVGNAIAGDVRGGITVGRQDFGDHAPPTAPQPTPAPPASAHAPRNLPGTLSGDGVHFTAGYALLIGVGAYQASGLSVEATAADATALATLLCDDAIAAYPEQQVRVLSGASATRAGILAALEQLAAQLPASHDATVLLFFAGHGLAQGSDYYLLPHDYSPINLAGTGVSGADFRAAVDRIAEQAQRLVVVLNCCHAGGVGGGVLSAPSGVLGAAPTPAFYAPLAEGSGRVVISASKPDQRSGFFPDHTVLGKHLLAALGGQAPGAGEAIDVLDLFGYLARSVPPDAAQITDPFTGKPLQQRPLLDARQVDAIPVALRPGYKGGTLGGSGGVLGAPSASSIRRLAEIEIQLARYASEAEAPRELVAERDRLLASL